jgi:hypothetical protein
MKKQIYFILTLIVGSVLYTSLSSSSGGVTGLSSSGCSCHGNASTATTVAVAGFPSSYVAGQAYTLTLTVTNGTKVEAGFDLTVSSGTISSAPAGTTTSGTTEIYHTSPQTMVGGVATWIFVWTAPSTGAVTLNVAGNAVNNNNGTSGDQYATLSLSASPGSTPLALTTTATNVLCFGGNGVIAATGSGGTSPYTFSLNNGGYTSNSSFSVVTGTYTVSVKDASNATTSSIVTITSPSSAIQFTPNTTQVNVLCFGGNSGSISAAVSGGTPSYQYRLNSGAWQAGSIFSALVAGTYTLSARDANLCSASSIVTITQPPVLSFSTVNTSPASCNGLATGTATVSAVGGNGQISYVWMPGNLSGSAVSGLAAGTYTCSAVDANACTTSTVVTIGTGAGVTAVSAVTSHVLCFGGSNGSAVSTASGGAVPYTYVWSPAGGSTATASGLGAGIYTLTVTDNSGCTGQTTVTITSPTLLTTSGQNGIVCTQSQVASLGVVASGGTVPYTYTWPGGGSGAGLGIGTYTVIATDANGCSATTAVSVSLTSTPANAAFSVAAGVLTANQLGATSYQWFKCNPFTIIPGASSAIYTVPSSADYGLIVFQGNCSDTSQCTGVVVNGLSNFEQSGISIMQKSKVLTLRNITNRTFHGVLVNLMGSEIMGADIKPGAVSIDLSAQSAGVYYLIVDGIGSTKLLLD